LPWSCGRVMRCRCRLRRAGWARVAAARRRSCGGLAPDGLRVVHLGLVLARVPDAEGEPTGAVYASPATGSDEGAKSGLGPDLALYVALRTSGGLPHPCLRVVHLGLVLLREGASGGGTRTGPGAGRECRVCVGGGGGTSACSGEVESSVVGSGECWLPTGSCRLGPAGAAGSGASGGAGAPPCLGALPLGLGLRPPGAAALDS
jgi:hypothetical protein